MKQQWTQRHDTGTLTEQITVTLEM